MPVTAVESCSPTPSVSARSTRDVSARLERPDAIASAVTDVLAKPSYRDNARRLADATSKTDPLRTLDEILIDVSARPSHH